MVAQTRNAEALEGKGTTPSAAHSSEQFVEVCARAAGLACKECPIDAEGFRDVVGGGLRQGDRCGF